MQNYNSTLYTLVQSPFYERYNGLPFSLTQDFFVNHIAGIYSLVDIDYKAVFWANTTHGNIKLPMWNETLF